MDSHNGNWISGLICMRKHVPSKIRYFKREESDTYLTHVSRHYWSRKSSMKIDGIVAFS